VALVPPVGAAGWVAPLVRRQRARERAEGAVGHVAQRRDGPEQGEHLLVGHERSSWDRRGYGNRPSPCYMAVDARGARPPAPLPGRPARLLREALGAARPPRLGKRRRGR